MKACLVWLLALAFPSTARPGDLTVTVLRPELWLSEGLVGAEASLGRMLLAVVQSQMNGCDLVAACNGVYCRPSVLQPILSLPSAKQVRFRQRFALWDTESGHPLHSQSHIDVSKVSHLESRRFLLSCSVCCVLFMF